MAQINSNFDIKDAVALNNEGRLMLVPGYVDMTCRKCGTVYKKIKRTEAAKFTCKNCKKEEAKAETDKVYGLIEKKNRMELNKYGNIEAVYCVDILAGKIRNIPALGFIPNKNKVKMTPNMIGYKLGTLTVTHYFVGATQVDDIQSKNRFICKCSTCGSNLIKSFSALYEKKTATCEICSLQNKESNTMTTEELESKIGKVYNNSTIIGVNEDGFILKCGIHNKKADYFTVSPLDLKLNTNNSWCPKCMAEYKLIKVSCPNCGEELGQMTAARYFAGSNNPVRCKTCGSSVNINEVKYFNDKNREYYNVLSKYEKKELGFKEIDRDSEVAKYCMAYIGTDGNPRYNCYCMKHNQELVLTDAEYEAYSKGRHKYCDIEESKFISMIPTKTPKVKKTLEKDAIEKIRPR